MKNPLESPHATLLAGLGLAVIALLILHVGAVDEAGYYAFLFRWLLVLTAILWIGLLYHFNFVQTPSMPKIPDEQKPAISTVIAPSALFWFRWAAAATVLFGLITAHLNGYLLRALLFLDGAYATIGIGMWLALIMAANVWVVIWPNQKQVLGLFEADAEAKKKSARTATLASRANVMLSIPMVYCMVAQQQGLD